MLSLPRGVKATADVPLATASWATPEAVERLAYRGGGSLFVGAIPASENWPALERIYDHGAVALAKASELGLPLARRAFLIDQLESLWRSAQLADCVPLGLDDDRHFLTIAGTRSGKGISAIIPNLCLYPGSVICLDPKGENATLTAERRGRGLGQDVYVLDPFGVSTVPDGLRASFNPLALLDENSPDVVDDAGMIAECLVVPGSERDAHWDESGRNFIKGLILHLITTQQAPTLLTLRRFLIGGDRDGWEGAATKAEDDGADDEFLKANPTPFAYLLNRMRKNRTFNGIIAGAAETLLSTGENERGSILSTARRNTAFLDSLHPEFVRTLEGQGRSFRPDVFKTARQGATCYLCLPAQRMATHGRWLRLMIGVFLEWAYRDLSPPACGAPVLFLLEEFYALGHMAVIEKAAGYAAGFGVKLWAILQDIPQLKAMYPRSWQTFLANAGAMLIFGVADPETTHYVSQALGETEIIRHVVNVTNNVQSGESVPSFQQRAATMFGGNQKLSPAKVALAALPDAGSSASQSISETVTEQLQTAALLRPDEITIQFSRESGAALLLVKGRKPIWCLRVDYFASPWFTGMYRVPPDAPTPPPFRPMGERNPQALADLEAVFATLAQAPAV